MIKSDKEVKRQIAEGSMFLRYIVKILISILSMFMIFILLPLDICLFKSCSFSEAYKLLSGVYIVVILRYIITFVAIYWICSPILNYFTKLYNAGKGGDK